MNITQIKINAPITGNHFPDPGVEALTTVIYHRIKIFKPKKMSHTEKTPTPPLF